MFLVAVKYDEKSHTVQVLKLDENFATIIESIEMNISNLGSYTVETNSHPLNYSVDRNNNVKQDVGSFNRLLDFNNLNNQVASVILCEIKDRRGKSLGYKLLNCANFMISNITTDNILAAASRYDFPIIQNAIIRNNAINCYPNKPFITITASGNEKKRKDNVKIWLSYAKKNCDKDLCDFMNLNQDLYIPEVYDNDGKPKQRKRGITTGYNLNTYSNNIIAKKKTVQYNNEKLSIKEIEKIGKKLVGVETASKFASYLNNKYNTKSIDIEHNKKYNKAQNYEIDLCKRNGVDPELINNPDLSNAQMRVIWKSKSNGALAEAFNKPYYPVSSMKFYADRIFTKDDEKKYKKLLAHPELSEDELNELYLCIHDDIKYDDLIGESATDIFIEREHRRNEDIKEDTDFELFNKALKASMILQGYI